ncbi:hypothetical protein KIN34_01160 [Cellulomonas sp. DKR-3]|uniref:Aminoglycoside phosphotransferase domain-containing protein n=1 Tax=Cellulomonas fulva TaxID=2835530 RepID=A0ABS5TUU3_9CELL|nr:hypothetical protein [Cellulomonas fulva]MBT0992900.1 hypothetical protein [Cellulomonas fulva]
MREQPDATRPGAWQVDGSGGTALDALVRQLWAPWVDEGAARVVVSRSLSGGPDRREAGDGWRTRERYWAAPDARAATMLVPAVGPRRTAALLKAYGGLRDPRTAAVRASLASAARCGLPAGLDRVDVQVREGADVALPLDRLRSALHRPDAVPAIGVRRGANAKPTLQLFGAGGEPVAFAKLAWDEQSTRYVETERTTLEELAGTPGVAAVLASGEIEGRPYVALAPLPPDARRVRSAAAGPSAPELARLAPAVRRGHAGGTEHLRGLDERLGRHDEQDRADLELRRATRSLLEAVFADRTELPVAARWHGDLVPWNVARAGDGVLWVWDWETCEPDAVVGLDALHWFTHAPRRPGPGELATRLRSAAQDATGTLLALGCGRRARELVLAVYALVLAERGMALARARGGWGAVLVQSGDLLEAVRDIARVTFPRGDQRGESGH